jgi:hypothetical protein
LLIECCAIPGVPLPITFHNSSLVSAGSAYSEAVLKNPEAATRFMPEKVLLTPLDKFDKLDRVFVTKLVPPTAWVSYSAQLAKKSLGSPAAKPIRKVKAKEKSAGPSKRARSPADSTASSQSDEEKEEHESEAVLLAKLNKVRWCKHAKRKLLSRSVRTLA